ncbi:alpha/beta hydrolase [Geomonas anaerohicana]|uniref:Alpha/beta hydrolase n=1 Tax=Geomonas anaerohicana TaxID=2798583 RepID=A0ABS0Y8S6_9BACT|nr:alpha/beta hydrolase [Geomonas anaerohicana]MBJ6748703.1 alpha/beta hydrolase [Geomonas anaerohicana]
MERIRKYIMVGLLLLLPAGALAQEAGYAYPLEDSYAATILGTPKSLKAESTGKVPIKTLILETDRDKPEAFFYDRGLRYTVVFQDHKAPLVFLIAGTGGGSKTGKMLALIGNLYRAGYHVVGLPSPTFPNFIIDASTTHVPGNLPDDAADLYRVMERIWARTKGEVEVSGFLLAGYSLGGTEAAFVMKLDEEKKVFGFRRAMLINPAVSLYDSVARIEGLLDRIPGGPRRIGAFYNRVMEKVTDFYRKGDFVAVDDDFLFAGYNAHLLSPDEGGGIIGVSFRISSAGMIFTSDVMTHGGYIVPRNRELKNGDSLQDYFWTSLHISFLDYFDEYFFPYFRNKRPGLNKEALIEEQSLRSIESYLASTDKVGVITNEDDFILAPGDLDYLRRIFGPRLKVYPRGGHLGNLEYRDNMAFLIDRLGSSAW